jgi:hypothetical protein
MTRRKRETRGHKRGINITRKSVSDRCRRPEPFRHQAEQDRSTALQRASAMRPAPPQPEVDDIRTRSVDRRIAAASALTPNVRSAVPRTMVVVRMAGIMRRAERRRETPGT